MSVEHYPAYLIPGTRRFVCHCGLSWPHREPPEPMKFTIRVAGS